jgi:hypothetical protein
VYSSLNGTFLVVVQSCDRVLRGGYVAHSLLFSPDATSLLCAAIPLHERTKEFRIASSVETAHTSSTSQQVHGA